MKRTWITLMFLVALFSGNLFAQTGQVTGKITDSANTLVSGATITAVSGSTARTTTSNNLGVYTFFGLQPGVYEISVKFDGFKNLKKSAVTLAARQVAHVDFQLEPLSAQESSTSQTVPAESGENKAEGLPSQVEQQVTVTARRFEEEVQDVPIPVSVVTGDIVDKVGAFNVNRLKEMIPTVQFYSSNPRNSSINIRGLGSPFGLTNDGIEPGVGFYVDGVFYARPASASLDFIDLEQIEVLRGPQGTLFGKNTTAGAINVTTRKPSFTPTTNFELSYGNLGFIQAKASVTGPLYRDKIAARLSFSGTQRDGVLYNVKTQDDVNDLNNIGVRGQFLFVLTDKIVLSTSVDYSRQRAEGYAQVIAGVAPTRRNANQQYAQIARDLGYTPPSFNPFDRVIDTDTPWRSNQSLGGASATLDWNLGRGQLTSISAWRFWDWDPSNDRDFTGLPVTTISSGTSKQRQWTQEIRYAGRVSSRINFVAGTFFYRQRIDSDPVIKQEQGSAAARFLLAPSANAATPGLLTGYGFNQYLKYTNLSAATFGQFELALTNRLRIIPGIRFNYDQKYGNFNQQIYGGLQTTNTALVALQRSILAPQAYVADVNDNNVSGQVTLAYTVSEKANAYFTYSTGYKSVGLNLGGVPTDAAGNPALSAATVKPEHVHHFEFGVKTRPLRNVTANITAFNTNINDFQTQVVNAQVGVLRGYLANAKEVRVRGIEFDGNARINDNLSLYGSAAYTDAKYISFVDAPPPLEDTGGPQVKDISGSILPGVSRWAASFGSEYSHPGKLFGREGSFFAALDASYRSSYSSSPSYSQYLIIDGYPLLNPRVGFRWADGWSAYVWSRNVLSKNYFELLSAAPGNSGLYVGLPGDPRTFGITLRRTLSF
ncbi:MAG TPA: TonB-dependent receptor [Terriglobales bacterium]|nr:TonB-dependent receptor [Terriglobales bacterium]